MKKGSIGEETIHLILIIILLIIVGVAIVTLVQGALNKKVDSFSIESSMLVERVLRSGRGLSYADPVTGIRPGIIDYPRISAPGYDGELDLLMESGHPLSSRITIKGEALPEVVLYYHRAEFEKAEVYHGAGVSGEGSVYWREQHVPVLLRSGGRLEKGVAVFEIALPKSLRVIS